MRWIKCREINFNCLAKFLLLAFLVATGCANDERLEGLRENVVENQVRYIPDKVKTKLKLKKANVWDAWTQRGRSAKHDIGNLKYQQNIKKQNIRKKVGPKGTYAEPVVISNVIYILTPNGYVVAHGMDGSFLWEIDITPFKNNGSSNILGGLAIVENNLIVTSSLGEILSIDTKEKKISWRFDFKRPFRAPPIIHKRRIYALTGDDIALSLDFTGKLRWTKKGPQKTTKLMSAAAPAASGNRIFFPFSGGSLVALNAINGLQLWSNDFQTSNVGSSTATIGDFGGDPVVVGSRIYSIGAFGELFASTLNGKVIWRNNISGQSRLVISGNSIFFISGDNSIVRVESKTGKMVYRSKKLNSKGVIRFVGPLLVDNKLLVYSTNGYMIWFNAESGLLISEKKIDEKISSAPIIVDMKIIFVSSSGVLNIQSN